MSTSTIPHPLQIGVICAALLGAGCAVAPAPPGGGVGGAGGGGGGAGAQVGSPASIVVTATPLKAVAPTFFGGNYWSYVKSFGNQVAGTETLVSALKLRLLRIGGTNADTGMPELFTPDVVAEMVTYARAVGAEPLVQISSLTDPQGAVMTAASAGAMVRVLNVDRAMGIRYFAIGNEPDIYVENGHLTAYTADEAATRFSQWSDAMKAADPTVKIVGPDLSWRYQIGIPANDWLTPFLARCKDKVDVVAFHRYPLDPAQAIDTAAFADAPRFRTVVKSLRAAMDQAGMAQTPLALTEYNVTWDGTPAISTLSASPGTLPAALWMADVLGVGLEEGLWSMDFWSISEGWTLGVLAGTVPRPAYQVLKLWGSNAGTDVAAATSSNAAVSAYATSAGSQLAVFVINKTSVDIPETISFGGIAPAPANVVHTFPGRSFSVVTVSAGMAPVIFSYGPDEARSQAGPTQLPN